MNTAVVIVILGLAATGEALKCYSCKSAKAEVAGLDLGSVVTKLTGSHSCDDFDPSNPDKKFEQECSAVEKACIRIVDPKESKNQMRGCIPLTKEGCEDNTCYCSTDLCNGAGRGWPSAVLLLLAAVLAALVGR